MHKLNYILAASFLGFGSFATSMAFAQVKSDTNLSAIASEREKTLGRVNAVTADQSQALDNSLQLSKTRDSEATAIGAIQAKSPVAVKPRGLETDTKYAGWSLTSMPALETPAPSAKRLVKRAPQALTDAGATKPQFTPDFSRQKAQLAELVGRPVIDLPRLELNAKEKLTSPSTEQELAKLADQAWSMADIVNVGIANSPVLASSNAQMQAAADRTGQARADYFPTLSARIARGPESSTQVGSATDSHLFETKALRLAVPLYNRTTQQNHRSAVKLEESAKYKQRAEIESVALALTKSTVDVATTRLNLDFADELLGQMNQILGYVEARTQSGVSSQSDLERARTRLLTATQTRLDLQAAYKTALYELERQTGQSPVALRLPTLNSLPGLPATKAEIRQVTLENNSDLLALRQNVAAQEAAIAAITGRLLPTVGLSFENDKNTNISATSAQLHNQRSLVVLAWGANTGGKEIYAAREAKAELSNRVAQLEEETRKIEQSIDADFALLQSATLRINAGQSEQAAATKVVDSVKEQIKTGRMGSLLDALDASERLYGARSRVVAALGQQMQAQAQLLRWLGNLSAISEKASLSLETASPESKANSTAQVAK